MYNAVRHGFDENPVIDQDARSLRCLRSPSTGLPWER